MSEPPPDLPLLLDVVRRLCERLWARVPTHVGLLWGPGERVTWIPLAGSRPVVPAAQPPPAEQTFVPTPYQNAILDALEGVALRTDALGAAVGDRSRLFRHPGGLRELRDRGLVDHHERRGYFRPDAPPEELS